MLENGINNRNWFFAAPARLPGFHVCVGSGGERQLPEWYKDNGKGLSFFFLLFNITLLQLRHGSRVQCTLVCIVLNSILDVQMCIMQKGLHIYREGRKHSKCSFFLQQMLFLRRILFCK